MASLFQGDPLQATSYTTSSTETPKWMQDAIYNQIQVAQNIANRPYEPYSLPTVAGLSPLQQQAYTQVQANQGAWKPAMASAQAGMLGQTTGQAGMAAAQPFLNQSGATTAQALSERAMAAANPYLQAASQTSAQNVGQYISPYQTGALDIIAKQGARNLSENLLPGVSDAFVRAGQFGGTRMGEFGSRALRDTQEAILNQQAQMVNQGYGQALGASQADLARQAQLAGTVGGISGADLSRVLQGAGQYGQLAGTAGQLSGADAARQMSALQQVASMAREQQGMQGMDVAALEAAGGAQQTLEQRQLDAARQQYEQQRLYPQQQMDWLSTQIRGMAPITPQTTAQAGQTSGATYSASPLSQLAGAYGLYKGLTAA